MSKNNRSSSEYELLSGIFFAGIAVLCTIMGILFFLFSDKWLLIVLCYIFLSCIWGGVFVTIFSKNSNKNRGIYETEDLVVDQTGEAIVDVTGHKSIRLQVVATSGNAGQVLIKDVVLNNR